MGTKAILPKNNSHFLLNFLPITSGKYLFIIIDIHHNKIHNTICRKPELKTDGKCKFSIMPFNDILSICDNPSITIEFLPPPHKKFFKWNISKRL